MKRMFERKEKKRQSLNEPVSKRVPIPTEAPDSLITVPDYEGYQLLNDMLRILPGKCREFLDSTNADEDNGSYMDQYIDAAVAECLCRLEDERVEHERTIRGSLLRMNLEKRQKIEDELENMKLRLADAQADYDLVCKVCHAGTAFEKYKEVHHDDV